MQIKKILSDDLEACYCLCRLQADQHDFLLVASEVEGACYAYNLNNGLKKQVVWQDVGGSMSIVQIPGTMDFLATQKFYPGFDAAACHIVYGKFAQDGWQIEKIANFPYLHRFDVMASENGQLLFIGCTIANSKREIEDWSDKGKVIVGNFDRKELVLKELRELPIRLTKNHGYYAQHDKGYSLITAVEGVVKLTYPDFSDSGDWTLECLFNEETSDIVCLDINQDGQAENIIIQGFHGDRLRLLSQDFTQELYSYPSPTPFGHALWAGNLMGQAVFVFGFRAGKAQLRLFYAHQGHIESVLIDEMSGASNTLAFEKDGKSYLFSANNARGEVALYQLS
ncbi:hypothetical protein DIX44_09095 [Streptococcus iniae]|uniref:hypothetical protein n=1 Tax=Streptococcus iniae TaxID=1346 RepID=UPI000EF6D025|nr:hypothetical protein [Streptococcus iniae]RLV41245.1 hypothetical protein DIX44_09095 [Streptococcus iniae]